MLLNLQNSFEDKECMYYSVLNCNIFLPIVSYFSRIFEQLFEQRQVAACHSSKEFCANPRNVLTKRKRAIAFSCIQKIYVHSKAFGVKRLRTY
jgi:hypothetical protein